MAWIRTGTSPGLRITSAIPPVFEAYATVVAPHGRDDRARQDRAMLALLGAGSADQPWWLGYLETGADDVVFPAAPRVTLYAGWHYVLVRAGPAQAAAWGPRRWWSRRCLPDLMYPADRSWLVSRLWEDEWTCIGGPRGLPPAPRPRPGAPRASRRTGGGCAIPRRAPARAAGTDPRVGLMGGRGDRGRCPRAGGRGGQCPNSRR